jgi:tRNA A-37 threonylcarbamoyl transferase component Bud32
MNFAHVDRIERRGWQLAATSAATQLAPERRERLVDVALAAAAGNGARRIRRSRHAESYLARLDAGDDPAGEIFIKVLDAPHGIAALKHLFRTSRVEHVAAITASLNRDGFLTPPILLYGRAAAGRELLVTARAAGTLLPRSLRAPHSVLARKRAMLRALGATVARMHRAGYIHGDLTPYNVFVTSAESSPEFIFIDHERTRQSWFSRWWRPRLRNLVQLGRFELSGLSMMDRMRVWRGYAAEIGATRADLRRAARMLRERVARDREHIAAPSPAPAALEAERR